MDNLYRLFDQDFVGVDIWVAVIVVVVIIGLFGNL